MRLLSPDPVRLCPYADETTIDLGQLGESGLYLITGTRGPAKPPCLTPSPMPCTGSPAGRPARSACCAANTPGTTAPPLLKWFFEYGGRHYTIRRSPDQMRPAKRGEGLVNQPAEAEIHLPDGRLVTKPRGQRMHQALCALTGEQFTRVAMIAQGDF